MEASKHPIYKAFINSANILNMSETPLTPKQRAALLREKLHICDLAAAQFIVANEQLDKEFPEWVEYHKHRYSGDPCSEFEKKCWELTRGQIIDKISELEK